MSDALSRLAEALSDRYRLERELGQGGMATVYLAQDLRHDRKVALKVLKSGGHLMAVDVAPGPTFVAGTPRRRFSPAGYRSARNRQQYDNDKR